jgi:hypothetical protein
MRKPSAPHNHQNFDMHPQTFGRVLFVSGRGALPHPHRAQFSAPVSEHSQEVSAHFSGKGYQKIDHTVLLLSAEFGRNRVITVGRDNNLFRSYSMLLQHFFQLTYLSRKMPHTVDNSVLLSTP